MSDKNKTKIANLVDKTKKKESVENRDGSNTQGLENTECSKCCYSSPELITSISNFAWPIVTLILFIMFKDQLNGLLSRMTNIKGFGGEAEFDKDVENFEQQVDEASRNVNTLIVDADSNTVDIERTSPKTDTNKEFDEVLEIAKHEPELGIMKISSLIEKNLREIIATQGLLPQVNSMNVRSMIDVMNRRNSLAPSVAASITSFLKIRNEVVHGKVSNRNSIIGAIDIGLNLLNAIKAIPHEKYVVKQTEVPIYSDEKCTKLREDVKGVILESSNNLNTRRDERIYATTKTHFSVGKQVAWEWNTKNVWNDSWYLDENNEPKMAWGQSGEFVGRNIDDL